VNLTALEPQAQEIIQRYDQPRAAVLPLLWLVQENFGHISSDAEFWVGRLVGLTVSHVREVVSFYSMFRTQPAGRRELRVCTSLPCLLRGANAVLAQIEDRLKIKPGETTPDGEVTLTEVECLCACEIAPMAQLDEQFIGPLNEEAGTLDAILQEALSAPTFALGASAFAEAPADRRSLGGGWSAGKLDNSGQAREPHPFISTDGPVISTRFKDADGTWWDSYVADAGYVAAKKALLSMTPAQIIDEVSKANLRGLGGAGFPTGRKWSFIPKGSPKPKYLVVNADEGEPGTFKDRYILERDPHALLEGVIIAAYAIGSHKAYVYIRGEYFRSARRFGRAVEEAYARGWLGTNIQGSGFDLDVVVHRGAGAYICGEETALLTSLEGGKGFPKLKPPFPAISGLFQCPTIVNNVETLACLPFILRRGAEHFAGLGTPKQGGTRLFSVCGHVNRPGVYEAPVTVTLRELIENYAQGVRGGRKLKAVIPGGISAKVLTADEIDVRMDFDSLMAAGTMAGSGGVIVMDETTSMVEALQSAAKFFAHESCGQCSPCREGTGWVHRIMHRMTEGKGRLQDLDELLAIARDMEGKTICVFADAAAWPVQSYITKFRAEFEEHIRSGRCLKEQQAVGSRQ
jgi:NADH-quinone oxidoreductase subunit F